MYSWQIFWYVEPHWPPPHYPPQPQSWSKEAVSTAILLGSMTAARTQRHRDGGRPQMRLDVVDGHSLWPAVNLYY
jgi:hypothetical protein